LPSDFGLPFNPDLDRHEPRALWDIAYAFPWPIPVQEAQSVFFDDGHHETTAPDVFCLFSKPRLRCLLERLHPKASFLSRRNQTSFDPG
jgi:hypothetical protein